MENSKSERKIILIGKQVLAKGYNEIPFAPPVPTQDFPTRADCRDFQFISVKQLCNLSEAKTGSRHTYYTLFGGDNGDKPVIPERQTWEAPHSNRPYLFVLVSAVEDYFVEIGVEW